MYVYILYIYIYIHILVGKMMKMMVNPWNLSDLSEQDINKLN
jgi:hypothetical protein